MIARKNKSAAMAHIQGQIERLHQDIENICRTGEYNYTPLLISVEGLRARFEELRSRPIRKS